MQRKIVHVITRLILGGAQENTVLTCEGLHQLGHEVTLITGPPLGREGQLLERACGGGYRVIVIDDLQRPIHPLRDRSSYRALTRHFKQLEPDIVHTHSSKAGILARRAAYRCGVPMVVHSIHGLPFHPYQPWWMNKLFIRLERRCARYTDAIISVADSMTAQALAAGIGETEMYTTIRSGMEIESYLDDEATGKLAAEFRQSLNLAPDAILVTQVARLAPLKGQEYIVEAASRVADNVVFCLVGDGENHDKLSEMIAAAGLSDRFRLTGLLSPDQIPAVMHASDILIHCSLHEGLARTLPQALLAATPVISFDIDGASEVVLDGECGVLVAPEDIEHLAKAINSLAADSSLRQKMGASGRQHVRQMYDWRTMASQIDALYNDLAKIKRLDR